jgi:transposase
MSGTLGTPAGPPSPEAAAPPPAAPAPAFGQLTHYAGFDWAKDRHHVAVVDPAGTVLLDRAVDDTAEGWAGLRQALAAFPKLGVAIETSCGPAVERLLEMGLAVYPLNPKAAERYRDRKRPGGGKSDPLDGWSFADALRTDGRAWRPLCPLDPLTMELRILCRDEIGLIEQRTALVNQLQEALHEYYPAALRAFDNFTAPAVWDFVLAFPTPQALAAAGKRKWEKFLHAHKLYRPQTAPQRLECFAGAASFASPNPAVTAAKSFLAVALAEQLRTLQGRLDKYRARIEELFARHPDRDVFGSLPGAGDKIAPRLLAEIGTNREVFRTAEGLQSYAGAAPVTRQSGRTRSVAIRRACNKVLRATTHLWADLSRPRCAWAQAYYQRKRDQGKGHATALRCLANRWLKILWRMWHDHAPYEEARHTLDQVSRGSWAVNLLPADAAPQTHATAPPEPA